MDARIAIISIIIENVDAVEAVNTVLHDYGMYIIGRMGIPYRERNLSIISVAVDAPTDVINTMAGSIGKLEGVGVSTVYSKLPR